MIASGVNAQVQSYVDDVLNGGIVVCKLVRLAVERHVADLEKAAQDLETFPYYFDHRAATGACEFFPIMLRHSIGDYAGLPFDLQPWQMFGLWVQFGWKRNADDSRRFRRFYKSVARKNGKSPESAGLAVLLAMLDINPVTGKPEDVAEVILAATKKEQVDKVMYAEIERMRGKSPELEALSTRENKQITFKHNAGSIRCVGSDKPFDGLNPHAVIMDELHEWREHHRDFWNTMQTGSGSRSQPLVGAVTTAGSDKSYLWKEEYEYARGVLEGTIPDEAYFAYVFELDPDDDPLDESTWIKANPNLGVSVKLEYLREQASRAATSRVFLNQFTRYHGNRLVSSLESAFDLEKWDECVGELSNWKEADAIGQGVDLGARDDLAAFATCARYPMGEDDDGNPIDRYELRTQAYIAQDSERDLTKQPFANFIHNGYLEKCKYPTANLKADLLDDANEYGCHAVAFDPYNAQQLGDDLETEGVTAARMAQTCNMQNEPILDFIKAIADGRVTHNGDPLLRWAMQNAVTHTDRQGRVMLDKKNSKDKIDPAVAAVMAFRMACKAPRRPVGSLYL